MKFYFFYYPIESWFWIWKSQRRKILGLTLVEKIGRTRTEKILSLVPPWPPSKTPNFLIDFCSFPTSAFPIVEERWFSIISNRSNVSLRPRILSILCWIRHRGRPPQLYTSISPSSEFDSFICERSNSPSRPTMTESHKFWRTSPFLM